jgi:hypothetical protein
VKIDEDEKPMRILTMNKFKISRLILVVCIFTVFLLSLYHEHIQEQELYHGQPRFKPWSIVCDGHGRYNYADDLGLVFGDWFTTRKDASEKRDDDKAGFERAERELEEKPDPSSKVQWQQCPDPTTP